MAPYKKSRRIFDHGGSRGIGFLLENQCGRSDRNMVMQAVVDNGLALKFASSELRNSRDIVLAAVKVSGEALRFASAELRGDRHVVLAAVASHGKALRFAAPDLQNDREVVLAALTQNGGALDYASSEVGVALARDPTVVSKHLCEHYVLIISLLSGRSCVLVMPDKDIPAFRIHTTYFVRGWASSKLGVDCSENEPLRAELLLDGLPLPSLALPTAWPGVHPGRVTELQLVLSAALTAEKTTF
mmetsp:Transcript_45828/g.84039  ORF Transcript_45828/g.84039 Transcript_45828/m.84039 type:complete len:244 (+) Transcript_45828:71-802(+)